MRGIINNKCDIEKRKRKTGQSAEINNSTQSISRASTYLESTETIQDFITSIRLNDTDQAQNLEVEAPNSTSNMVNTIIASASSSCTPLTTLQNPNNTIELSGKSVKLKNSSRTLRSHASRTLPTRSKEIKSVKAINVEDNTYPTGGRSLNKKKTNGKKKVKAHIWNN
ncbi:hypothetical protein C2G38_2208634 [Gigaspora rosea]|uniref:Uncharacterized protein n=1 Tax=Gigaspora rosea TaxID=44941 RepID=A0A397UQZ4_9GLOM|nr:hypothetical protein C2G38_2208634 [Gigaspora rosea]